LEEYIFIKEKNKMCLKVSLMMEAKKVKITIDNVPTKVDGAEITLLTKKINIKKSTSGARIVECDNK